MDVARLGLAVDSSQVEKGTVSLHQLTGAAGQASVAAQKLAGASQVEAAGQKAATSATIAHTAALNAQHAVMRSTAQQRTMMVYQLNDIAVSLASGMNPAMVAMQQGSQILQGGFMPAVRTLGDLVGGLVTKFWPLAAVIGVASAAIAGMTNEINETSAVTVGFGDVALATWQVIAGGIYEIIRPAVELLGGWFGTAWDWVVQATKDAGNWIIRSIVGSIEYVKTSIGTLPAAFVVAGQAAAQGLADAVAGGINSIIGNINSLAAGINQLAGSEVLGQIGAVNFGKIEFGGTAAMQSYEESWGKFNNTAAALGERDFMGQFFGAISGRAQELALARQETEALAGAAGAANDNVKKLADDGLKSAADRAKELADNLGKSIGAGLRDLISGAKDFGQVMFDVLGSVAQFALQQSASLFGGMGGGFGFLGSILSGLFGGGFANGGVFNDGHVQPFARGGVVNGPTLFPMANGAGLMGEAGPEAIMPLRRGADGKLGVAANSNGSANIHVTVGVVVDERGNILPFVQDVARQEAQSAAAAGTQIAVAQANKTAPAAVAGYQKNRAGGDWRL